MFRNRVSHHQQFAPAAMSPDSLQEVGRPRATRTSWPRGVLGKVSKEMTTHGTDQSCSRGDSRDYRRVLPPSSFCCSVFNGQRIHSIPRSTSVRNRPSLLALVIRPLHSLTAAANPLFDVPTQFPESSDAHPATNHCRQKGSNPLCRQMSTKQKARQPNLIVMA